jgi:hypothetical protein
MKPLIRLALFGSRYKNLNWVSALGRDIKTLIGLAVSGYNIKTLIRLALSRSRHKNLNQVQRHAITLLLLRH